MLKRIDHVQLAMPAGKEPEARRFWCEVMGLREVPKPPNLAKRGGCWFESADRTVVVHCGVDKNFQPATKAHIAFDVEDVGELAAACRSAGYEPVTDEPLEGYDRIYCNDPFGNRLEFLRPR